MQQIVNQQKLAEMAGVSQGTVSRALAGSGLVSSKTHQRIARAAAQLGYAPNILAKGLRGGRTMSIAIFWSIAGYQHASEVTQLMALRFQRRGYVTHMAEPLSDPAVAHRLLTDFLQRRVDGVIFQSWSGGALDHHRELVQKLQRCPAVVVVAPDQATGPFDAIVQDRTAAVRQIADQFVRSGRRRPIAISSDVSKTQVLREQLAMHGVELFADVRPAADVSVGLGRWTLDAFFAALGNRRPQFDAVWCSTDEGAIAMMSWLRGQGVRVPEDVAVVGFNNDDVSQYLSPSLSSVERHDRRVAELATDMLLDRLENPQAPRRREHVAMEFVARQSSGLEGSS